VQQAAGTGEKINRILIIRLKRINHLGNLGVYDSVILKWEFTPQNLRTGVVRNRCFQK
jgi:hypothetical protein